MLHSTAPRAASELGRWGLKMKKVRIVGSVILGFIVFVCAVYVEVRIRDRARTAIPVESDVSSATVSAYAQPDF